MYLFLVPCSVLLCHLACACSHTYDAPQVKAVDYGKNDVRAVEDCQAISAAKVDEYLWRAFDGRMEEAEAAFAARPPFHQSAVTKLGVGLWSKLRLHHTPAAQATGVWWSSLLHLLAPGR